jgi:osmoprotectant transport system substrate-binding protein
VVVGSKNDTEQIVLGEIVAQHLERRLEAKVERRLGLGGTETLFQALIGGTVGLYPEYTGTIGSVILKEQPSSDPATVLERARSEILRVAQSELIGPLGFDNPPVLVVRAADAVRFRTLSAAAAGDARWKIGVTFDFQQRDDGLRALNRYRLPLGAAVRSMDPKDLFPALEKGQVNMIAATATDGRLDSAGWGTLADDQKVFPPQQALLLVRQDLLDADPRIRAALAELAGRITQSAMRAMNAKVDVGRQPAAEVAGAFLAEAGPR